MSSYAFAQYDDRVLIAYVVIGLVGLLVFTIICVKKEYLVFK